MYRVLVTARAFRRESEGARQRLREFGAQVDLQALGRTRTAAEMAELVPGYDAIIASSDQYTEEVFAAADRLKVIARWGVGVDTIDLAAATRHGVVVTNTPGMLADAVADLVFAFLLGLARKLLLADRMVRDGRWEEVGGVGVWGKTLGIVGLGSIGKAVARRAQGFDLTVLATDIAPDYEFAARYGVTFVPLEELLAQSDFVTLHVPLTPATQGLIGEAELRQMRPTAYLINCGRGALVDEPALVRALQEGWIAGAGLDVFAQEPPPPDHPLLTLDNCLFTPHSGFNAAETVRAVNEAVVDSVIQVLTGQRPLHVVNPEVYRQ